MSPLQRLLEAEVSVGIERMLTTNEGSHSFHMLQPGCEHRPAVCLTFLMLFLPSDMDQEIYDALKPIIERRFGPGTLVEPHKRT